MRKTNTKRNSNKVVTPQTVSETMGLILDRKAPIESYLLHRRTIDVQLVNLVLPVQGWFVPNDDSFFVSTDLSSIDLDELAKAKELVQNLSTSFPEHLFEVNILKSEVSERLCVKADVWVGDDDAIGSFITAYIEVKYI